jgi:hypothetical protein
VEVDVLRGIAKSSRSNSSDSRLLFRGILLVEVESMSAQTEAMNADLDEISEQVSWRLVEERDSSWGIDTIEKLIAELRAARKELQAARDTIRNMNDYKKEVGLTECIACGYQDSEGHHIGCPLDAYERLRAKQG